MEHVRNDPGRYYVKYDASYSPLKIAIAKRVLEELRWREEGLLTNSTDSWHLEELVCTLAGACRSELAFNTGILIEQMSPKSRRKIYEVLLTIVENIPSSLPKLHTLQYPKKGSHDNDGWSSWFLERHRSREYLEEVMAGRALKKAYLDSLKQKPRI